MILRIRRHAIVPCFFFSTLDGTAALETTDILLMVMIFGNIIHYLINGFKRQIYQVLLKELRDLVLELAVVVISGVVFIINIFGLMALLDFILFLHTIIVFMSITL